MTESAVEEAALSWFSDLGYQLLSGPDIAPETPNTEQSTFSDVVLRDRLAAAVDRINPSIPADARDEAIRKVLQADSFDLVLSNRTFHRQLINGIDVEYSRPDGTIAGDKVWLVDFEHPDRNDWLAVNQFTVIEHKRNRRPDIVVFLNGLPIAIIELKDATDEKATVRRAFNQLQTYKRDIPSLFQFNEILVVSDGLGARVGSLTADWERFMPWRTISGDVVAPHGMAELPVLIHGIFDKQRLLDLIRHFVVFDIDGPKVTKMLAGYHQFHAVNKAVTSTVEAAREAGDHRAGVVWHTQGSGKSLSMVFYAGKVILHPSMENPTLVVLTDRNDLDDQLFGTFANSQELLRQTPVQADSREHVRELLKVASGGVIFTTIQKFLPDAKGDRYPQLSDRHNIVVIADEAHRSQYDFIDGFARHLRDALPNASFIAFTGTPIEGSDRSTKSVFGEYIDIYDIQQAVEDGATVRIFYESRLAKLNLDEDEKPVIDAEFEEVTEDVEGEIKERLKSRWARLEAMVGAERRVELIAKDVVEHFENRLSGIEGKGMIVCMSRRICVDLYAAIVELRPEWHSPDDDQGFIKVVMTGSASDDIEWQQHIRPKAGRKAMAERFKDPDDPLTLVIVRDMWLTGFDAPSLHTMYVDKPMRGHGLMQAIARVNRVFRDKPGGLVVDYIGIAEQLKAALSDYTERDRHQAGVPVEEAVAVMLEKYEVVQGILYGYDWEQYFTGPPSERLNVIVGAENHVLSLEDGKRRYRQAVTELSKAFALSVPHEAALEIRDELSFFQAVGVSLVKHTGSEGRDEEDLDHAVRQIVSKAVASDEVIDLFGSAGLKAPDISILSDEFLDEVRDMPQRNLALEVLRKLLNDEIRTRADRNVVEARSFREMLEQSMIRYNNRSIQTAEVIHELIELAQKLREAQLRGEKLGLAQDELAFYDALATSESAVAVMGDETLRAIAKELVGTVRNSVTIDWTMKESVQARLRTLVKRTLRKYKYPPDQQEQATVTVLQQAELFSREWAA